MAIFLTIIILAPYLLIPAATALFYKKRRHPDFSGTYYLTAVLIFFYPIILIWLSSINQDLEQHGHCYTAEYSFVILNTIVLVPVVMLVQWICNKFILKPTGVP